MSDRFQEEPLDDSVPNLVRQYPPLPAWLERRILDPEEEITWVRGPWQGPWWERYATHPLLILGALAVGGACVAGARLMVEDWSEMSPLPGLAAIILFIGTIFVTGISAGFFTRLVVTDFRVMIVQGREVCRVWDLDDLPYSLIRYTPRKRGEPTRTIDLDAVKTLFGQTSNQIVDSRSILAFGKQLDQIKTKRKRLSDPDRTERDED
jgi:hypothetical protein